MSRIAKMNFAGFSLSAAALLLASSAFLMGCGQPPAQRIGNIPGSQANTPISVPQPGALPSLDQFNQAQLNSLVGTYRVDEAVYVDLSTGDEIRQALNVTISRAADTTQPGGQAMMISISYGNFSSQARAQVRAVQGVDGFGPYTLYTLVTEPQKKPDFNVDYWGNPQPFAVQFQTMLDQNNVFDPAGTAIRIVDLASMHDIVEMDTAVQRL